jgi:hypothetical protein
MIDMEEEKKKKPKGRSEEKMVGKGRAYIE